MQRVSSALLLLLTTLYCVSIHAADTLARIKQTQELRLGYFEASAPFSFSGPDKSPQGYSVDLCERVAAGIQRQLGVNMKRVWIPLALNDRIEAVRSGRIDIECGTSTWTFSRQKVVDFSLVTFIDGASLLATARSKIRRISDAGGKRIAVIRGTTTEKALADALAKAKITANIVSVDSRDQGLAMVTEGKVDAYASDRFLLMNALTSAKSPRSLRLIDEDYSVEPYALVLPRDDYEFRLTVNRALGELFRSGEIQRVYERWFAKFGKRSLLLSALYYLQAVPE